MTIPTTWHELTEYEVNHAWHDGYRQALHDIATSHAELNQAWRDTGYPTATQRYAARLAEFTVAANQLAERMGRPGYEYHGGPVNWNTGQPARHLRGVA